jgi:VWFA-related protein
MTRLMTAVVGSIVMAGTQAMDAQRPTFSSRVEAVRVDVLVTDKGQPVLGLQPSDFEVLDNGVPQRITLASFEQIPLNIVLALDMSDSVAGESLRHLQAASSALLEGLKGEDRAALVTFSHVVALGSDLTKDVAAIKKALDQARPWGETALTDASYAAITLGESDVGRALVIVFSDGVDTSSWLTAQAVLETARRTDAVVYGVSSGTPKKTNFLRDLSVTTGGTSFEIESTKDLSATFVKILEEFRHRYLVSYSPTGVERSGWHKVDVRVPGKKFTIKARPGYLAGS